MKWSINIVSVSFTGLCLVPSLCQVSKLPYILININKMIQTVDKSTRFFEIYTGEPG